MAGIQRKSKQGINIMLFRDCKFRDKANVRKTVKEAIIQQIKTEIPFEQCNEGRIYEYVDILLDDSKYNVKRDMFYYGYRHIKIDLSVELFSKVAAEYINEHLEDFLLIQH